MLAELRDDVTKTAVALAASLIAVDGVIENEEKEVAVKMGHRMLPGFSKETFDIVMAGLEDLPSAYELAAHLRDDLEDEDKDTIINYLVAVATADEQIVAVEGQELEAVAEGLGVPLPPLSIAPMGS